METLPTDFPNEDGNGPIEPRDKILPDNQLGLTPTPEKVKEDEIPATQASPAEKTELDITTTEIENSPEKPDKTDMEVDESEVKDPTKTEVEEVPKPKKENAVEEKDFPMVTREQQQAFKEKGAKVLHSDSVSRVGDETLRKRPATSKKSMAKPKKTNTEGADEPPKLNRQLASEFKAAADSDCEVVETDTEQEKKPPSPKLTRPSAAAKAKAKAKTQKARAKAKASPKKRTSKTKNKKDTQEKTDGKGKKPETAEEGGKATFAGRRCPSHGSAESRFLAMRKVFQEMVAPKLVATQGTAEDCPAKTLWSV